MRPLRVETCWTPSPPECGCLDRGDASDERESARHWRQTSRRPLLAARLLRACVRACRNPAGAQGGVDRRPGRDWHHDGGRRRHPQPRRADGLPVCAPGRQGADGGEWRVGAKRAARTATEHAFATPPCGAHTVAFLTGARAGHAATGPAHVAAGGQRQGAPPVRALCRLAHHAALLRGRRLVRHDAAHPRHRPPGAPGGGPPRAHGGRRRLVPGRSAKGEPDACCGCCCCCCARRSWTS